jgi:Zn-dependent M28 family amino/carboxypeptidase
VLEAARAMAALAERPRRSVLFLFFTAEEKGLLGSIAYLRRPTIQRDRMRCMINLDMVGRNADRTLSVSGARQAPALGRMLELANAAPGAGFRLNLNPQQGGGSDHMPFIQAGVPAVHFFSGFHDDYHQVGDHADKIVGAKVARAARLALMTAWLAADAPAEELPAPEPKPEDGEPQLF